MPPQAGVFALPYKASRNVDAHNPIPDINISYNSTRSPQPPGMDDSTRPSKDKKRRELVNKLGKDLVDYRRDDTLLRYSDTLASHQQTSRQLAIAPHTHPEYILALYPISLERSARLHQLALDEQYALDCANLACEEEHSRVEEEWRKGRERIRDRMLEGIEERRKRAREDKDGEGTVADSSLDAQSRPHITRKLRNKIGSSNSAANGRSPSPASAQTNGHNQPNPTALTNPYSLALDTLPSPFPMSLPLKEPPPRRGGKQSAPSQQTQTIGLGNNRGGNGDGGIVPIPGTGASIGLGKSLAGLSGAREMDIEGDLTDLRRGARRKRAVAASIGRA